MLHKFNSKLTFAIAILLITFSACKKDPFTEKDALTAQGNLLQLKSSFDLQIAQVNASASRSHDSALIVIQNLVNSGASSLAILQATQNMAYLMQQYQNSLAQYKYQDSVNRATSKFNDSLTAARSNTNAVNALKKNYNIKVSDAATNSPVLGATASVYSYTTNSILTATTDANGQATFSQIIVDPSAPIYINKAGYSFSSIPASWVSVGTTITLWNNSGSNNTIKGQVVADQDFTNGDSVEGVAGQLISFSLMYNNQTSVFPAVSDASGNYSVKVPDAPSGLYYSAKINNQISVSQKMYVHYEIGIDNPQTTTPYIDTISTTLQLNGWPYGSNAYNPVTDSWVYTPNYKLPSAGAFYYSLPADKNANKVISYPTPWSFGSVNFLNTTATGYLSASTTSALSFPSFYIPTGAYAYTPNTTVSDSLIDLSGMFITTAPRIVANVGAGVNNNLTGISFVNDPTTNKPLTGAFVNLYTATGRLAFTNLFGLRSYDFINNSSNQLSNNTQGGVTILTGINNIQGGATKTLNFDYNSFVSRAKNPN